MLSVAGPGVVGPGVEQIAGIGLRRLQELLPGLGDTGVDAVLDGDIDSFIKAYLLSTKN